MFAITGDLYYKHVTIVNDDSSIVSKQSFKFIDNPRVVYDRLRFIVQATGVLDPGKPFQPGTMFVSKAVAYQSVALFRCCTLWWAPVITINHYTRLERTAKDKHSSLL